MSEVKEGIEALRRETEAVADRLWRLRQNATGDPHRLPGGSEAIANMTLAYRHLENAIMRLEKTLKALDGGTRSSLRTQEGGKA